MPRFLRSRWGSSTATEPSSPADSSSTDATASTFDASQWASLEDRPPCCEHLDEAETWAGGSYGPSDVIGGGGLGGFTAWYFPLGGPGVLQLVQNVAAQLKDTLVESTGRIAPHPDLPTSAESTALAARIDALPEPDRTNAFAGYRWSGTAEQEQWLAELEATVEGTWGSQHRFFLDQPCWDWIGADVNVDVRLRRDAKASTDHMGLEAYKTPPGESLRTYGVSHRVSDGAATDAYDQSMRLASTSTQAKEYDLLRESVAFEHDSAVLTPAARATLTHFIATYDGATAHPAFSRARIDLVGRASSSGSDDHNLELSERRAEAVREFLTDNGLADAPIRVRVDPEGERAADQTTDDPADRRVDLVIDGGQRMVTASHEFGHAFGLGDEYADESDGRRIGDDATHHDMVTHMTDADGHHLPGAAIEHTGGIMSYGNEVRPQHYASFHHALQQVTGRSPWALGTRTALADTEAVCSGEGMPPCTDDTCLASSSDVEVVR